MDVILIPGLWLDAASWDDIAPALESAGHRVHALTLPGVGAAADEAADIGIADWVDAVVAEIDQIRGPVVLVGHSGGGNVAWGATDLRTDRVARVVFVDTVPPPPGADISEFDVVDGVVPFPGWDAFDEPDVADLDAETRERTAALAMSVPPRVPTDALRLFDERRFEVPVTILSGALDETALRAMVAEWPDAATELTSIADLRVVRLGTGHWPQFSHPERLAALLVAEVG